MTIPFDQFTYIDTSKPRFWKLLTPTSTSYPFGFYAYDYRNPDSRQGVDTVEFYHSKLTPELADKFLSIVDNLPTTNPEHFL